MTRKQLIMIASAGSLALLLGAWTFQFFGYPPCKLCYWQRYPHGAAVAIGIVALVLPFAVLALLGAIAAATTGVIGIYHTGIENNWWEGPTSCTSSPIGGLTPQQLMDQIMAAPLIRCDEVAWSLFGISMASWNALFSFALVAIWLAAFRARA